MKKREWNEALDYIDADLVEEYILEKDRLRLKRRKEKVLMRTVAVAACLAIVVGAVVTIPMLLEDDPTVIPRPDESERETIELPPVPSWDDANYSAGDIADMIAGIPTDGVNTNSYVEVYVPDSEYLNIGTIPDAEYLGIYEYIGGKVPLDTEEFKGFINGCIDKLTGALGVHQFAVTDSQIRNNGDRLLFYNDTVTYDINFSQNKLFNAVTFANSSQSAGMKIVLSGETVHIDQRLSNEEIISSLDSVKEKLFEIFNVSFSDAKVIRSFDGYSTNGATNIYVYFYNSDDDQQNLHTSMSDYLRISFDNFSNYKGDIVSDSILSVASVSYRTSRGEGDNYSLVSNERMIALKEAEALLYNGYVFSGHYCPLCLADQEKISFVGYDFVDVRYVFGVDQTTYQTKTGVPFYVFYKKIGVAQNGNYIYAKTMVPAIEVKGLKEHFESNAKYH